MSGTKLTKFPMPLLIAYMINQEKFDDDVATEFGNPPPILP